MRRWVAQTAAAHLATQGLLRGFGQIGEVAGEFEKLSLALLAVLGGQPLPFLNRIDLHGEKYSAARAGGFGNGVVSGLAAVHLECFGDHTPIFRCRPAHGECVGDDTPTETWNRAIILSQREIENPQACR